ncbi:MAG: DUF952 domain-containing protein [Pseudomonadota bacterium]
MLIYKIFRPAEWDSLTALGETHGAPIDLEDGFIHFSTAEQARETAEKHFADAGDLVLAAVETDRLGQDLKWEVSRGNALFPHLYRALRLEEVAWHAPMPRDGGSHVFPDAFEDAVA